MPLVCPDDREATALGAFRAASLGSLVVGSRTRLAPARLWNTLADRAACEVRLVLRDIKKRLLPVSTLGLAALPPGVASRNAWERPSLPVARPAADAFLELYLGLPIRRIGYS